MSDSDTTRSNFIRDIIDGDLDKNTYGGRVVTRFPPEPNGYLHIGHAKSICLNFGLAEDYDGDCHLRFDDTNPTKEDQEYVDAIIGDVAWLGFQWAGEPRFASDYFDFMHDYAVQLIRDGRAYVDSLPVDTLRAYRGSYDQPGRDSPHRDRTVEENLELFGRMRAGEFPDGAHVLRAKIRMDHPNMLMRDPLLYRIKHATHHRSGDDWCIYPMYDFAHCLEDAVEHVTHSICTLEFESNRELYDWVLDHGDPPSRPRQYEFARLGLDYTVMSKRKLLQLVQEGHVSGWDDPRLPTLAGLRRRGVTPESIRAFCDLIGVAKNNSTVDIGKLEYCLRTDLNQRAPRVMCVLEPLKVVITNYPEGETEELDASFWPHDVPKEGSRRVPFSRELYVERADFAEEAPKGWYRLTPGQEVRLRYGYVIRCDEAIHDPDTGEVAELRCTYDPDTRGGTIPDGRKVRGTIHWVSAAQSVPVEVRLYDRLFRSPAPDADPEVDFRTHLNPDSLVVLGGCRAEPGLAAATAGQRFQFERQGYFVVDPVDSTDGAPVFGRIITLRDSWARVATEPKPAPPQRSAPAPEAARSGDPGRSRGDARRQRRQADPALSSAYTRYTTDLGLDPDVADRLTETAALIAFFDAACAAGPSPAAVARWVVNELRAALKEAALSELEVSPGGFGRLVSLVEAGTVSAGAAKEVLSHMLTTGKQPEALVKELGLDQVSDESALEAAIDEAVSNHPDEVARFRAGETKLLGFLMGQVMRLTGGSANPKVVRELLSRRLA